MMKQYINLIFINIVGILFLTACQSEADYRQNIRTWLGKTEAELVASRGVPDQAFVTENHIRYLTYYSSSLNGQSTRVYCNTNNLGFSSTTSCEQLYCKEVFRIEKNVVAGVKAEGNNCL